MFDLVIRNGTIIDGTGRSRFLADVAVSEGRVAQIGEVVGRGAAEIDATGLVVCPGFVDPHTHYDAQICWDPLLGTSAEHGVTTVVMGNCGVGVAPVRAQDREKTAWDLVNLEGMAFDTLAAGVNWEWESFPELLDALERRGCGINLAHLVPLSQLRRFVIGDEANARAATATEKQQIAALLEEAIEAGGWGFSSSAVRHHVGFEGKPLAARLTSRDEFRAYAQVLRRLNRGAIEITVTNEIATLSDDEYQLLDLLLTESGRNVTWLAGVNRVDRPEAFPDMLAKAGSLIERGGVPQVMTRPLTAAVDLRAPFPFGDFKVVQERILDKGVDAQLAAYQDPAFRAAFRQEKAEGRLFAHIATDSWLLEAQAPQMVGWIGKSMAEIAAERGTDALETFFDLACQDALKAKFLGVMGNGLRDRIPEMLTDPRVLIGLSDGGAHVDMMYEAGYTTYFLGHWVRDQGIMPLERAIKRLTSEPADFFGMAGRGRLLPGAAADIVLFDYATIGSAAVPDNKFADLPAGGTRLHAGAQGIQSVIVNGQLLYRDGRHVGGLPGQVLRSHASTAVGANWLKLAAA